MSNLFPGSSAAVHVVVGLEDKHRDNEYPGIKVVVSPLL